VKPVYITRLSKYLPNDPVGNDEMEQVLGMVGNKPSKARAIVLRSNGIKTRYYAYRDGKSTHTNAALAANAVKALFDDKLPLNKLQVLAAGTSSPEQTLPSHAAMVHGEIKGPHVEIVSSAGACCSGIQAMKYAYMSVAAGLSDYAVSVGSEKVSSMMHASRFDTEAEDLGKIETNPYIAFEKDFLRWMLSDGAGAALMQPEPNKEGVSLKIEWIEIRSYADEFEACMYGGAIKNEDKSLIGWNDMDVADWAKQSVFSFKQDHRLLADNIVPIGGIYLKELMEKHGLTSDKVDYYLPHMSSEFFKGQIKEHQEKAGLRLPDEKWFYNLTRVGNVGSASAYLMLEELMSSGKLKKGDGILVMVPESARFSYAYMYLTVV
jgi:3-oxoacyl-[acyl-carrier-protein] synthase-3